MDKIGGNGFAFTWGTKQTKMWGGGARTVGNMKEMTPLRAVDAGSIAMLMCYTYCKW